MLYDNIIMHISQTQRSTRVQYTTNIYQKLVTTISLECEEAREGDGGGGGGRELESGGAVLRVSRRCSLVSREDIIGGRGDYRGAEFDGLAGGSWRGRDVLLLCCCRGGGRGGGL